MNNIRLSKYQERYDRKVLQWLERDYDNLIVKKSAEHKMYVAPEMRPENGGFELFVKKAEETEGFKLGYVPLIDNKDSGRILSRSSFYFGELKGLSKPITFNKTYGNDFRGCGKNILDIKSFGISLSIIGWYRFLDNKRKYTVLKIKKILKDGLTIEDVFPTHLGIMLVVDGEKLNLRQLCEKFNVNRGTFKNKIAKFRMENRIGKDEKLSPSVYLTIIKKMKKYEKPTPIADGFMRKFGNCWLMVDDRDVCEILSMQKRSGKSVSEIIHDLLGKEK